MRLLLRALFIGTPIVLAAATAYLFFILPQLVEDRFLKRIQDGQGMVLAINGATGVSLADGLAVTLGNVTVAGPDDNALASIPSISIPVSLSSLFTGEAPRRAFLDDAVFTFAAAAGSGPEDQAPASPAVVPLKGKPFALEFRNATLKATDADHDLVIAITDISGDMTRDENGSLSAKLRGLLNGAAATLELTVDDLVRLRQKGSPADIRLASGESQVVFSGRLGMAHDLTFDGSVAAESPNLQLFLKMLGLELNGFATATPVALDAGLSISKSRASFRNLAFSVGEGPDAMQAKGTVDIQAASPRPKIEADLAFNVLNVNTYLAKPDGPTAAMPPDLNKDWSEHAFSLSDLKVLDARITAATQSFAAGAIKAGPTRLAANLADGALSVDAEADALQGGKASLKFELANPEKPGLALDLKTENVDAGPFLAEAFGISLLAGSLNLSAVLKAEGRNPAQLVSTLAGVATLSLEQGELRGLDLAAMAGLVTKGDSDGWNLAADAATTLTQATATASFNDGIATLNDTNLEAAGLGLGLTGTIDLLRRAIDLQAKPSLTSGSDLPVAVAARGPWERPRITAKLDTESLPEEIEDIANGTAKKAKKALKKLLGD